MSTLPRRKLLLDHVVCSENGKMQDKLLSHIAVNASQVFQSTVRLFPPGFPKTEEEPFIDYDSLRELEEDLLDRVDQT